MAAGKRSRGAALPDGVKEAIRYAEQVIAGEQSVCELVRLACARFLSDLEAAAHPGSQWEFRPDLAERPMQFAELLPNIKGPLAGQPLRLMPWQQFVYANIFGFVERETGARRFRQATIWVPKGNGKTTIAAPTALYMTFADGEGGAEGYAAAVTRDQAKILFDTAQNMVRRAPEFRRNCGVKVMSHSIFQEATASSFVAISSDAGNIDGKNVQIGVCDELGSHKTSAVYNGLLTALGKRKQPLLLTISTATANASGIGRQTWDYGKRVLEGAQRDDRLFVLIYTIDEKDDPWEETSLIKANPSWGFAVQPDAVRAIMRQARNNAAQEAVVMTRHLNVWVGANEALFSTRAWIESTKPGLSINDLAGAECHIGLDLASKTDIAALAIVFHRADDDGKLRYRIFCRCYLNDAAVMEARNPSYPGWAKDNYLTVTDGNETDFSRIEDDLLNLCGRFRVASVAYDPWAATQFAQRMLAQGVPMVEFRAITQNFSEPTKELDAAMRAGRIEHDGNPVLTWAIGNVVGKYDARGNVYPRKARPEEKIDPAIATIMAVARCMTAAEASPYSDGRGLLFLE